MKCETKTNRMFKNLTGLLVCENCISDIAYLAVCRISGRVYPTHQLTKDNVYIGFDVKNKAVHCKECRDLLDEFMDDKKKKLCRACDKSYECAGCEKYFSRDELNNYLLCRSCESNTLYCLGCGVDFQRPGSEKWCDTCQVLRNEGKCVQCEEETEVFDNTGRCEICAPYEPYETYFCANNCGYRGVTHPEDICDDCIEKMEKGK